MGNYVVDHPDVVTGTGKKCPAVAMVGSKMDIVVVHIGMGGRLQINTIGRTRTAANIYKVIGNQLLVILTSRHIDPDTIITHIGIDIVG